MDISDHHVAPLNFSKMVPQDNEHNSFSTHRNSRGRLAAGHPHVQMTPPLTPHSSREEIISRNKPERSMFHNYLRAFYPFQPSAAVSDSTVTLPLDQGDIILVHSVHTNGWADGTLLDTGARGWLPTNYCEAYDPVAMKPLLKALTDFWDLIRSGDGTNPRQFNNQDYMRGLVAGIRFLLEKKECLRRESDLVQRIDGLRRNRKALLSDVKSLAKLGKLLQELSNEDGAEEALDNALDQMLLKAFRIVTRGVRFLDVWNEEVGLTRAMEELERPMNDYSSYDVPLTPPADASFSSNNSFGPGRMDTGSFDTSMEGSTRVHNDNSTPSSQPDYGSLNQQQPFIFQQQRASVSHRVSYNGPPSGVRNPNLASERLGSAYDGFLGVLGSFIGLHLQSRSSTELILTTTQSVQSCNALLSVVEAILEHDMHRSEPVRMARDAMYGKISELVRAAREAFHPGNATDEGIVFLPEEGRPLVDAATDCVRGAGDCVAKSRRVLEEIGDFEFESIGLGISTFDSPSFVPTTTDNQSVTSHLETSTSHVNSSFLHSARTSSLRPPPPPLKIPNKDAFTPAFSDGTTPYSQFATALQTPTSTLDEPMSCTFSSFADLDDPLIPSGDFSPNRMFRTPSPVKYDPQDSYQAGNRDTTSTQTTRDSEMSGVSQTSTRATTPDINKPFPSLSAKNSFQGSNGTLVEEAEESFLEKTFAHELMLKDGQVIGGSLRALIEKLTAHQSTPDALFVSTFYLTFRHFSTPTEFAEALMERYDYVNDSPHIAGPVRLRVSNIFKGWLETHWRHDCDDVALPAILNFARTKLMMTLPLAGKHLIDLAERVSDVHGPVVPRIISSIGKTNTSTAHYVSPDIPLPTPIISKTQANLLKQWKTGNQSSLSILDFDPFEIARQLTLKESRIFCSILPEELLGTEWMKKSASLAVNVRAMSTLSTDLTNLVMDCILQLDETKKRAAMIKQWVKIATKCLELNNYDTLMAIICSLNSSTIQRLKRTWELVSQKTKNSLEQLQNIVDTSKNSLVLRQRLQNHVPPTLPFVGMYLTDLTFVAHGNQDTRFLPTDDENIAVINFDKHMKTAKIISELQRFQIPYRLAEVPELQAWIQDQLVRVRSAGEVGFQKYYRRSLLLEPREHTGHRTPVESTPPMFSLENAKDKFDFLAWTHSSKPKAIPING